MTDQVAGAQETATPQAVTEAVASNAAPDVATSTSQVQANIWPDDWREKMSGGDEKLLSQLQRHATPDSVGKSYREAQARISAGLKTALPDNPTEQQIADYRQANGIPQNHREYTINLPDGLIIGENDAPMVDAVVEAMHSVNASTEVVNAAVNTFFELQQQQQRQMEDQISIHKTECEESLRQELGGNYLTEMRSVGNMLTTYLGDDADALIAARLPDGTMVGSNQKILKALMNLSREINPAGTVVPGVGGSQMQSIDTEIASMEKTMKADLNAWHKSPELRARHLKLLEAKEKMIGRGHLR